MMSLLQMAAFVLSVFCIQAQGNFTEDFNKAVIDGDTSKLSEMKKEFQASYRYENTGPLHPRIRLTLPES